MKKLILLIVFLFTALAARQGTAESSSFNLAALAGFSGLSANNEFGSGYGAYGFGLRAGIPVSADWALSLEGTYSNTTPGGVSPGFTSSFILTSASLDYLYFVLPTKINLFAGPKIGLGMTSAGGASGSSLAYGGEVGADFFTSPSFSIGLELIYVAVGAPTLNGVSGSSGFSIQFLFPLKLRL